MAVIDPAVTIVEPGTYTVNATLTNVRAGITPTAISISNNGSVIGSGASSPTTASIVLTRETSGTLTVAVTAADSLGREYTDSTEYTYNVPAAEARAAVAFQDYTPDSAQRAFRIYDVRTMTEITEGVPNIAFPGLYAAYSPGGTHLAVVYLDTSGESDVAKFALYDAVTWGAISTTALPTTTAGIAHISWSASGRYVCAFAGEKVLLLDRDQAWGSRTVTTTLAVTTFFTCSSVFVGDRRLIIFESGNNSTFGRVHFYDLDTSLGLLTASSSITTIGGHTTARPWNASAALPISGEAVADVPIIAFIDTEDELFRNRLFVFRATGTVIYQEDLSATNLLIPSLFFTSDRSQVAYLSSRGNPWIPRRDPSDSYNSMASLTPGATIQNKVIAHSSGRESIVLAGTSDLGYFRLLEYNDTSLSLVDSIAGELAYGLVHSVSTNDQPINTLLPPTPAA